MGKPKPSLSIKKCLSKIIVDGELNEPDWMTAEVAGDFFQNFPYDTAFALSKTEVKVTYDEHHIYIGAVCYDELPGEYVIQSLRRDFSYPVSDAFVVTIEPFNDRTNGFSFGVNPLGAQREGLVTNGGDMGVTTNWDNKWHSAVSNHDGKWVVEMGIPFKSIRYNKNIGHWGINFARNDLKRNENSSWSPVPRQFNISSLAFTGDLFWDVPPEKTGINMAVIPYATGRTSKDFVNEKPVDAKTNLGLDAKIVVSPALNLDVTVNPDFSQVEVDRQITNLTRFSLFFPEQRFFFLENSDLFSSFGFSRIRPFFSRRIGLNNGKVIPIIGGARLSGKLTPAVRIGVLNMQTARDTSLGLESQNYTVTAFQRKLFSRSNVAAIFVNRQGFIKNDISNSDYNRIIGLDYNLATLDNRVAGRVFYHHSLYPGAKENNYAHASWLMYNTRRVFAMWNHEYVGANYRADAGFVPRTDIYDASANQVIKQTYWRLEPMATCSFYPKSKIVNKLSPGIYSDLYFNSALLLNESIYTIQLNGLFQSSATFDLKTNIQYTKLLFPTDITGTGKDPFLLPGDYNYRNSSFAYYSNQRKRFYWSGFVNYGDFFNGTKLTYGGDISFRIQPYGTLSLSYKRNDIAFPQPYGNTSLKLISPGAELSFSRSMFFTTFLQYNTQIDNFNINARFQWRFKPMSDLFIVYSDNYDAALHAKNRAIVLKFVYWFSV